LTIARCGFSVGRHRIMPRRSAINRTAFRFSHSPIIWWPLGTHVRRAFVGPALWPGPRRQARWAGRGLRRSRVGPEIVSAKRLETISGALDAGGASLDDARRSGPVPVILSPGDWSTWRMTTGPASSPGVAHAWCVTAGRPVRRGVGHRRGGQRPAPMRFRTRGSGPGCPATCGESPRHSFPPRRASRRVTLPRRPDHRRAVTRKDACGAGQGRPG
jgi:hypothetical protein